MLVATNTTKDEALWGSWFDRLTMSGLVPLILSLSKDGESVFS